MSRNLIPILNPNLEAENEIVTIIVVTNYCRNADIFHLEFDVVNQRFPCSFEQKLDLHDTLHPYPSWKHASRTWNPLRRFFPLLPAWWAHIENQRILNGYITGIIRHRWNLIQEEKRHYSSGASKENGVPNGVTSDAGIGDKSFLKRKRDILDKVLDSLEPGEWGMAAVLQARVQCRRVSFVRGVFPWGFA